MGFELAIVGMDCRFPKSRDVSEYWENLKQGTDCASVLDAARLVAMGLDAGYVRSPSCVGVAYELEDIEGFDAAFFGIVTTQAMVMSPQHRLILESAWNAFENSGYNPLGFADDVGVYIGSDDNTYYLDLRDNPTVTQIGAHKLLPLGNYLAYLPAWVSYKLNLRGPSLGVHTGCSSSLAAVHLACNSLLLGECRVALAGAVAARVPQKGYYHYEPGGLESADGHCRPFDAGASGSVFGNGVGTLVIKKLEDALADADTIHAVIKGSALNNDGASKLSFAVPNSHSWRAVITEALLKSDVQPESIGYIEAHGTGTPVGDALEIEAMTAAFRKRTEKKAYCAVGSAKANVGHLDAAAGMTGLIKTICMLEHGLIPPQVNFTAANPRIDFADTPFFVNTNLMRWPHSEAPRRAGVSAFGIGGANAHLILEEAPSAPQQTPPRSDRDQVLFLSAKTSVALKNATVNLLKYLERNPALRIEDVAYTLTVGRASFDYRRAIVCRSVLEAIAALRQVGQITPAVAYDPPEVKRPGFMLAGISQTTLALSHALYAENTVFRQAFEECADRINSLLSVHLVLARPPAAANAACSWVDELRSFAIQYGLVKVWMSLGIKPVAMIGWGSARYVVAVLCGVMGLDTALRLATLAADQRGALAVSKGVSPGDTLVSAAQLTAPRIPLLSEFSAARISSEEATDPRYWIDTTHASANQTARGIDPQQLDDSCRLVEVGLAPLPDAQIALDDSLRTDFLRLPQPRNTANESASRVLLDVVAHLWENGVELRKELLIDKRTCRRIVLPTYPFERKAYWLDRHRSAAGTAHAGHPERPGVAVAHAHHELEKKLLDICQTLLPIPSLGPLENFFDLGMNSLQINQLRTRIREDLGVEVPLQTLFDNANARGLSMQVDLIRTRTAAAGFGAHS